MRGDANRGPLHRNGLPGSILRPGCADQRSNARSAGDDRISRDAPRRTGLVCAGCNQPVAPWNIACDWDRPPTRQACGHLWLGTAPGIQCSDSKASSTLRDYSRVLTLGAQSVFLMAPRFAPPRLTPTPRRHDQRYAADTRIAPGSWEGPFVEDGPMDAPCPCPGGT